MKTSSKDAGYTVSPMNPNSGESYIKSVAPTYNPSSLGFSESQRMVEKMKANSDFYGVSSLMNPYSLVRLTGGLEVSDGVVTTNRYIESRRQKRWFDVNTMDGVDPSEVNNPTTTNIIDLMNRDSWGRTPYAFQDFVFCRWWNIIPNNRMITLRRYMRPCLDNLNFKGMYDGNDNMTSKGFSPMSTVVTYFGDETNNKVSDLLKFTTGYNWKDLNSDIWTVSMSGASGGLFDGVGNGLAGAIGNIFGDNSSNMAINKGTVINEILNIINGNSDKANPAAINTVQYPDLYESGPYANKIQGPVNSINSIKMREKGLNFSHDGLKITCEYVSRPIGNINTKAVMLDILANCLTMGTGSAVFFKGAHRFNIDPALFPLSDAFKELNDIMSSTYTFEEGFKNFVEYIESGKASAKLKEIFEKLTKFVTSIPSKAGEVWDSAKSKAKDIVNDP